MIVSRKALDTLVEKAVTSRLDHANLNNDVPELSALVPTTENLSLLIRQWLRKSWPGAFGDQPVQLAKVRVEETDRNSFEVAG
jgi:6-pyruvoyl-tetrahydropterin synthase